MMGDYHVRFCERLRGETPLCLLGGNKLEVFTTRTRGREATRGTLTTTIYK